MTTARSAPPSTGSAAAKPGMSSTANWLTTAAIPALGAGLISAGIGASVAGAPGVYGATIGALLTVGFFTFGQVVLIALGAVEPVLLMLVALLTYTLQVLVLFAVYAAFSASDAWRSNVSTAALGLTAIICTLVWTTGLVLASRRTRTLLFDLDGERS